MRKLFRQEAIDAQREKLLGEVSIARPVPLWVFTLLAAIAAIFETVERHGIRKKSASRQEENFSIRKY